jgi:hypothetical protein
MRKSGYSGQHEWTDRREFSGRKARQGRIVLDTPLRRTIFLAGLIAAVIVAFLLTYAL